MSKAQVSTVLYVPFILICSIIIVVGFAYLPTNALDETIQVSSLDGSIMRQRLENKIHYTDPLTLRDYPFFIEKKDDFKYNLTQYFSFSGKPVAYRLSFNNRDDYYNKNLFIAASTAVPYGDYNKMSFKKDLVCLEGSCGQVKFDQILPKVYYVK